MALSTHHGGAADKAGLIYESLWGIHAFVQILQGEASSIRIETPGDDGAEFQLQTDAGIEHWQAKRQITGQETWTLGKLTSEGILSFFLEKFRGGDLSVFASISDAPELRVQTENANASSSLSEFKEHFLDKKRRNSFKEIIDKLSISDEQEAYEFLKSLRVEGAREQTLEFYVGRMLGTLFHGPWQTTMSVLAQLFVKSIHETLHSEELIRELENCGIERRTTGHDLQTEITAATRVYLSGQRAKLIQGKLLKRSAAKKIVSEITGSEHARDFLIAAIAGGGKSACLFQVVEGLQEHNIPVLAFRLDRIEPVSNTTRLGEALGLTESPALALAGTFPNVPSVLVIDQVDCVSTTSGRHPDFFDTLAALREEVIALRHQAPIHLIVACRKFDFEHDHRLKQLIPPKSSPLELCAFSIDEVRNIIEEVGGKLTSLSEHQKSMLTLPQNLSLYIDARLFEAENRFTTSKDLCDEYWKAKRRLISVGNPVFDELWSPSIEHLASAMSERQELSVPAAEMDKFPPEYLDRLVSEGVLTWDNNRFGFGHETFFDYSFARTRPRSGKDFVSFLKTDEQHLFRRAQLRQVFAFQREDDFPSYLENVRDLLNSRRIRPHLKLLTIELIAAHPDPKEDELNALLPWIEFEIEKRHEINRKPKSLGQKVSLKLSRFVQKTKFCLTRRNFEQHQKLSSRVWDRFFHSRSLFRLADKTGLVDQWLSADEVWLQDIAALYLRAQSDTHTARIAEILENYIGDPDWNDRFRYIMEGRNLEKSRRFFDLFLRLLDDGILDEARDRMAQNGTFWSMLYGLAENRPSWCAELSARWLSRQVTRFTIQSEDEGSKSIFRDQFGADDILKCAKGDPLAFLENHIPAILDSIETAIIEEDFEGLRKDEIWMFFMRSRHLSIPEVFIDASLEAFERLGKNDRDSIQTFVEQLRQSQTYTANFLLLNAYLCNPERYADEALEILSDDPRRLFCGYSDSPFWVARKLIERCSPLCSPGVFQRIQSTAVNIIPPFEQSKDGVKRRGYAAYNLAVGLCSKRISDSTRKSLREWKDKFGNPRGEPEGIKGGFVGSPIEEESALLMTDEQWLRAIAKYDSEDRSYRFEDLTKGGALELARMLENFSKKEPERFAELALVFPNNTHPYYFSHTLSGISGSDIPFDIKLAVARRTFEFDQKDCIRSILMFLGTFEGPGLPQDAITYIVNASEHIDPEQEPWDEDHGNDILSAGINCVRGYAAEAIRSLIFTDASYIETFSESIRRLVNDPTLSVRATAASTIHAVFVHNSDLALNLFDVLIDTDDKLLGTQYSQKLLSNALREHLDRISPIISRMLDSQEKSIHENAGVLACLARLYHDEAEALSSKALIKDTGTKLGACEVASTNLLDSECREWCVKALLSLFIDDSEEVRNKAAHCFWHLWQSPETPLSSFDSLIKSFVKSKAFDDDPSFLLYALEATLQPVPVSSLDVCEAFIERCGDQARDISTALAADEMTVGKLVFSIYSQLSDETSRSRALDVIDQMSLEGLSSAGKHLFELER